MWFKYKKIAIIFLFFFILDDKKIELTQFYNILDLNDQEKIRDEFLNVYKKINN